MPLRSFWRCDCNSASLFFSGADNSEPDRNKAAYPQLFSYLVLPPPLAGLPYEQCSKLFLKTGCCHRIPNYWGRENQKLNKRYRSVKIRHLRYGPDCLIINMANGAANAELRCLSTHEDESSIAHNMPSGWVGGMAYRWRYLCMYFVMEWRWIRNRNQLIAGGPNFFFLWRM